MNEQDLTRIIERMIGEQIGKPVRYDPATGEFVVVGDDEPEQEKNKG